jgi:hypothetical protein
VDVSSVSIVDSGERVEFPSGMVRDSVEGKPDYTLIPIDMLTRWAKHMTLGAEKYGRENWRLACTEEEMLRFRSSAFRHFVQWLNEEGDEDHAAAVLFNISAAEYVAAKLTDDDGYPDSFA